MQLEQSQKDKNFDTIHDEFDAAAAVLEKARALNEVLTLVITKLPVEKTPEQVKARTEMWKAIDQDNNGHIELSELNNGLRKLLLGNVHSLFDTEPAIATAFEIAKNAVPPKEGRGQMEKDIADNSIEWSEFRIFLMGLKLTLEYWIAFKRIDKTNDNRIDFEEFKEARELIERWCGPIDDLKRTFEEVDTNMNGWVAFEEFCTWSVDRDLHVDDDACLEIEAFEKSKMQLEQSQKDKTKMDEEEEEEMASLKERVDDDGGDDGGDENDYMMSSMDVEEEVEDGEEDTEDFNESQGKEQFTPDIEGIGEGIGEAVEEQVEEGERDGEDYDNDLAQWLDEDDGVGEAVEESVEEETEESGSFDESAGHDLDSYSWKLNDEPISASELVDADGDLGYSPEASPTRRPPLSPRYTGGEESIDANLSQSRDADADLGASGTGNFMVVMPSRPSSKGVSRGSTRPGSGNKYVEGKEGGGSSGGGSGSRPTSKRRVIRSTNGSEKQSGERNKLSASFRPSK